MTIIWAGAGIAAILIATVLGWLYRTRDNAPAPQHAAPHSFRLPARRAVAIHAGQHVDRARNMRARIRNGENLLDAWQSRYAPPMTRLPAPGLPSLEEARQRARTAPAPARLASKQGEWAVGDVVCDDPKNCAWPHLEPMWQDSTGSFKAFAGVS
jgi:hypothetical protein